MNGKKARQLRQQANHKPSNAVAYNEAKFNRMSVDVKTGKPKMIVKITKTLKPDTSRAKYKDLKNLYRLEGI